MIAHKCLQGLLLACALWCAQALAKDAPQDPLAFELTVRADDKDIAPWVAAVSPIPGEALMPKAADSSSPSEVTYATVSTDT